VVIRPVVPDRLNRSAGVDEADAVRRGAVQEALVKHHDQKPPRGYQGGLAQGGGGGDGDKRSVIDFVVNLPGRHIHRDIATIIQFNPLGATIAWQHQKLVDNHG
jgi:hypothetical protein